MPSILAGVAVFSLKVGWFGYFMLAELAVAAFLYLGMRRYMMRLTWSAID